MKPVTIDHQAYLCPTWQDMGKTVITLAQKIADSHQAFDRVVALAKGGLSWNRQLQDLLQINQTSSIQVTLYKGINEKKRQPIVVQSLPVTIQNESILLFDDIADTGESLKLSIDYLKNHGAKSIKTACMFSKPWTTVTPDFYTHTTEAWVIFPTTQSKTSNF